VASRRFDDLIKEAQIIIEPVTELQARMHGMPIAISAKAAATLPSSISAIALRTRSQIHR
jgi:hypothetical protein